MSVDNFFFGIQAALASLMDMLRIISTYQMFIGFIIGFFVASVIHAILTTERASQLPSMILRDPAVSFSKVYPAAADGTFPQSYVNYSGNVQRMKTVFYASGIFIIILLMLTSLFFD